LLIYREYPSASAATSQWPLSFICFESSDIR